MPIEQLCQGWHRSRHRRTPRAIVTIHHRDDPPEKATPYCGVHARGYRISNERFGPRPTWIIEEIK